MQSVTKRIYGVNTGGFGASIDSSFPLFPFSASGKKRVRLSSVLFSYAFFDPTTTIDVIYPVTLYQVPQKNVLKSLFDGYTLGNGHGFRTSGGIVSVDSYSPRCSSFDADWRYNNQFVQAGGGAVPATQWWQRLGLYKPFFSFPLAAIGYGNGRHISVDEIVFDWDGSSDAVMIDAGQSDSIVTGTGPNSIAKTVHAMFSCVVDYV